MHRRSIDSIRPDHVKQQTASYNINDRIQGPHLVKVDLLDGGAMYMRLGFPDKTIDRGRICRYLRREREMADLLGDGCIAVVCVVMSVGVFCFVRVVVLVGVFRVV
jgi:hypothetical protein